MWIFRLFNFYSYWFLKIFLVHTNSSKTCLVVAIKRPTEVALVNLSEQILTQIYNANIQHLMEYLTYGGTQTPTTNFAAVVLAILVISFTRLEKLCIYITTRAILISCLLKPPWHNFNDKSCKLVRMFN